MAQHWEHEVRSEHVAQQASQVGQRRHLVQAAIGSQAVSVQQSLVLRNVTSNQKCYGNHKCKMFTVSILVSGIKLCFFKPSIIKAALDS